MNRSAELRVDKRPILSDLRESGAIEQDADVVCLLYREEYYNRDKTKVNMIGKGELILSKNRNGPTGRTWLEFNPKIIKFTNSLNPKIFS